MGFGIPLTSQRFPMLPIASHQFWGAMGSIGNQWETVWEMMGTQMGIDGNYWDELGFTFLPKHLPPQKVK